MEFMINKVPVTTDDQGFLLDLNQWSEEFAEALAKHLQIDLYVDHWELIWYFREFYKERLVHPSMHQLVVTLGKRKGARFRDYKDYEQHIYSLFPTDPIHEICRLAGLPRSEPDT